MGKKFVLFKKITNLTYANKKKETIRKALTTKRYTLNAKYT